MVIKQTILVVASEGCLLDWIVALRRMYMGNKSFHLVRWCGGDVRVQEGRLFPKKDRRMERSQRSNLIGILPNP